MFPDANAEGDGRRNREDDVAVLRKDMVEMRISK